MTSAAIAEPIWLLARALILLQQEQIAAYGGLPGVRDEGLLESALMRPQHRWHYEGVESVSRLAAAYGVGIARNHPFHDANKRTAFLAVGTFLHLNGWRLVADRAEAVTTMVSVACGQIDEAAFGAWLEARIQPC